MISSALIRAIVETCSDSPRLAIEKACEVLFNAGGEALESLTLLSGILSKHSLIRLQNGLNDSSTTSKELALALSATVSGFEAGKASPGIQLVWTGPETSGSSPRDTLPQMLEMIGRAQRSILLVTFAAFRAKSLMVALADAQTRGVELMIISETVQDSAGQLTRAAWKAFPKTLLDSGSIWYWPIRHRPKSTSGRPGKMHAKCLIVDELEFLITSANLTDDAMERNIEVGIAGPSRLLAVELVTNFQNLALAGVLVRYTP